MDFGTLRRFLVMASIIPRNHSSTGFHVVACRFGAVLSSTKTDSSFAQQYNFSCMDASIFQLTHGEDGDQIALYQNLMSTRRLLKAPTRAFYFNCFARKTASILRNLPSMLLRTVAQSTNLIIPLLQKRLTCSRT